MQIEQFKIDFNLFFISLNTTTKKKKEREREKKIERERNYVHKTVRLKIFLIKIGMQCCAVIVTIGFNLYIFFKYAVFVIE